eukprot:1138518-Pelagomonas_calceolata.AAC.2
MEQRLAPVGHPPGNTGNTIASRLAPLTRGLVGLRLMQQRLAHTSHPPSSTVGHRQYNWGVVDLRLDATEAGNHWKQHSTSVHPSIKTCCTNEAAMLTLHINLCPARGLT